MAWVKRLYEIEARDAEGPLGTYAALLTDGQAADIKALLDRAQAAGTLKSYRFVPYPPGPVQYQALGHAAAKSTLEDDIETAARRQKRGRSLDGRPKPWSPQSGVVRAPWREVEAATREYGRPELGAAVAVENLHDVLRDVRERHPGIRLREYDARGPRGIWDIDRLVGTVGRDLAAMTAVERAQYDVHRYSWGYDADGRVRVVHWPVHGGSVTQFLEE